MKEGSHIDELLNGYIDGVLTARQHTELQRLKVNDPQIERRLSELQKCKMLISSLPIAKAPADMLDRVKVAMQTETQVDSEQPVSNNQLSDNQLSNNQLGARQLMFRRVLASAAMIALMAVLAIIVYSITAPPKTIESFIVSADKIPRVEIEQPALQPVSTADSELTASKASAGVENQQTMTAALTPAANRFSATLELKTSKLLAADVAVKKVLEKNGAEDFITLPGGTDEYAYSLDCGVPRLNTILSGLENIWTDFSSATLIFDTAQDEQPVVVEKITTWQIAEIAAQHIPERRLKAAQYYAIMNNVQQLLPQQQAFDTGDENVLDLINMPKPKPVLTRDEAASQDSAESQPQIVLKIVIKAE